MLRAGWLEPRSRLTYHRGREAPSWYHHLSGALFSAMTRPHAGYLMSKLRIVQGDQGEDKRVLEQAARKRRGIPTWVVLGSSVVGDDAVVYISGYGFFATARINSMPVHRREWKRRFGSALRSVRLIQPPISLSTIQRHVPQLKSPNFPRSMHTPTEAVAAATLRLIQRRRKFRIPDLDEKALLGADLDEPTQCAV